MPFTEKKKCENWYTWTKLCKEQNETWGATPIRPLMTSLNL